MAFPSQAREHQSGHQQHPKLHNLVIDVMYWDAQ